MNLMGPFVLYTMQNNIIFHAQHVLGKVNCISDYLSTAMAEVSLDGICISCEVPSIEDTTLGISEQYPFFCHQTRIVGHCILRLHTFYKSTHVEFKTLSTVETLTTKA
jgi:hypothetical protein